jgi:hypothetical protein
MLKGGVERNVGWAINEVGQEVPRQGSGAIVVPENIKPLLDPYDHALAQQIGYLIPRPFVILQNVQERLVVELLPPDSLVERLGAWSPAYL